MFVRAPRSLFPVLVLFPLLGLAGCGGSTNGASVFREAGAGADTSTDASDGSVQEDGDSPPTFGDDASADSSPRQFDACSGASCFDGPVCGDGVIETGETCDDGNTTTGDGCSAS